MDAVSYRQKEAQGVARHSTCETYVGDSGELGGR